MSRAGQRSARAVDYAMAATLAVAGFGAALAGYGQVAPQILNASTYDYWFESDVPAIHEAMTDRWSTEHWRAQRHPLFPAATLLPVSALRRAFGVSGIAAAGIVTAGIAGLWVAGFFGLLRIAGLRRADALVYTGLAAASSAAVFWFPVPETRAWAALSLLPALMLVAAVRPGGKRPPFLWCVAAAGLTVAFTTTNWMVGLLMLLAVLPWKKAALAAPVSLGWVYGLWLAQKRVVPGAGSFLEAGAIDAGYWFSPLAQGPGARLGSLLFHAMVLPRPEEAYGARLSVQGLTPGTGGALPAVGVVLWAVLLVVAVAAVTERRAMRFHAVLGLALIGYLGLTQVYGVETFLYTVSSTSLLVAFVALAALSRWRVPALGAAAILALVAGTNNVGRFVQSAERLRERHDERRAFVARVAELTDPDLPLIYGAGPAAGEGISQRVPPVEGAPSRMNHLLDFPELRVERQGWLVYADDWSLDRIERYRQAGAAYFVSPSGYAIVEQVDFLDALETRFTALERRPDRVIYSLRVDTAGPAAAVSASPSRGAGTGRAGPVGSPAGGSHRGGSRP